jgi:hypothetical protein
MTKIPLLLADGVIEAERLPAVKLSEVTPV